MREAKETFALPALLCFNSSSCCPASPPSLSPCLLHLQLSHFSLLLSCVSTCCCCCFALIVAVFMSHIFLPHLLRRLLLSRRFFAPLLFAGAFNGPLSGSAGISAKAKCVKRNKLFCCCCCCCFLPLLLLLLLFLFLFFAFIFFASLTGRKNDAAVPLLFLLLSPSLSAPFFTLIAHRTCTFVQCHAHPSGHSWQCCRCCCWCS